MSIKQTKNQIEEKNTFIHAQMRFHMLIRILNAFIYVAAGNFRNLKKKEIKLNEYEEYDKEEKHQKKSTHIHT